LQARVGQFAADLLQCERIVVDEEQTHHAARSEEDCGSIGSMRASHGRRT
jgi:hypothetical protein